MKNLTVNSSTINASARRKTDENWPTVAKSPASSQKVTLNAITELPEPSIVSWVMLYTDDEEREAAEGLASWEDEVRLQEHETVKNGKTAENENVMTNMQINAIDEGKIDQIAEEIGRHDMHKLQRACPELGPIIRYLENNDLSEISDPKLAAQISITAPEYFLNENGLLHHLTVNNNKVKELEPIIETLVIPILCETN